MIRSLAFPLSCAVLLTATSASAAEPVSLAPPSVSGSAHRHDGFYMRLSIGFSAYNEVALHRSDTGSDAPRTYVTGMGTASELALGGTLKSGLVFGGGIWGMTTLSTDVSTKNGGVPGGVTEGAGSLGVVGPFIDYYVDPTAGFHLQTALGLALSREVDGVTGKFESNHVGAGVGAMFGFGNDWWVGDHWSVGVMGRVLVGATANKLDGLWYTHLVSAAPGVLFSVTYQ